MVIKCKLCGGNLNFEGELVSAKCDSCGIGQFIFDYLDKESEDYDEQAERIKVEKENFEKSYLSFADDILNADSYCLKAHDFKKAIDFFEKCGDYKEAPQLLKLAKKYFIGKVACFEDCLLAIKYIDEAEDVSNEEKQQSQKEVSDLAVSFKVIELDEKGFLAILPTNPSAENVFLVMEKIRSAKNKDIELLSDFEKNIVFIAYDNATQYIETNTASAVKECADIALLNDIGEIIPDVRYALDGVQLSGIEEIINDRLNELAEQSRVEEQRKRDEEKRHKKEKKSERIRVIAVILSIILLIACFIGYREMGYSANNIKVEVTEKTNLEYNENLADGYAGAGYFYLFNLELTNKSNNAIELVCGQLEILNSDGATLSSSYVEMYCNLDGKASETHNLRLNVSKGKSARELWNSQLKDLTIKFKIKAIHFKDGTNKNYSNAKNKIIYKH